MCLVACTDGVGTKLRVANIVGIHDTVGIDLVAMCVNDLIVQGAEPLFFLDYFATGKLEPEVTASVVEGMARACRESGCVLLGGETAEMPGLYGDGDFDLVGFIVGAVERPRLLDGSKIKAGQALIGLPSLGLHTNGYSLARAVVFDRLNLDLDDKPELLGGATLGEALLAPHKSYLECTMPLLEEGLVAGMAHITGGGLPGNVNRMLTDTNAVIDRTSWKTPGLFQLLVQGGNIEREESYEAFNMGVGLVLAVDANQEARAMELLRKAGEEPWHIGHLIAGDGKVLFQD